MEYFRPKKPGETLDYCIGWSDELGADTITSSDWQLDAGITEVSATITDSDTKTVIIISGGTGGEEYVVKNTIITSASKTVEKSFILPVNETK